MTAAISTPLVTVELLAASIWVGSIVCLAVVTRIARRVLEVPIQVTLFRAIGRSYASLGAGSLLVAIAAGLWLVWPPSEWTGTLDAAVGLSGVLVVATGAGMAQARAMTRLRRQSISDPGDSRAARAVHKGRRVANSLRGLMAVSTLAIVVLAAQVVSN
ncbi:MAG TPA: hypothetical protein VFH70_08155 [Acidimicrobiales bacterium]|nr:hypothetical protein [Acidimicrobiales bacterium]